MRLGEIILAVSTGAYALIKIVTEIYNWSLHFLQHRAEAKNPAAAAPLIEARRPLEELKALIENNLNAKGAVTINVSPEGQITIPESMHSTMQIRVGGFLHRHPFFIYTGMAFMHSLLYFLGRRLFSNDQTAVDSLREAVAAPAVMLGVSTYENICAAYRNTIEFSTNRRLLDEQIKQQEKVKITAGSSKMKAS